MAGTNNNDIGIEGYNLNPATSGQQQSQASQQPAQPTSAAANPAPTQPQAAQPTMPSTPVSNSAPSANNEQKPSGSSLADLVSKQQDEEVTDPQNTTAVANPAVNSTPDVETPEPKSDLASIVNNQGNASPQINDLPAQEQQTQQVQPISSPAAATSAQGLNQVAAAANSAPAPVAAAAPTTPQETAPAKTVDSSLPPLKPMEENTVANKQETKLPSLDEEKVEDQDNDKDNKKEEKTDEAFEEDKGRMITIVLLIVLFLLIGVTLILLGLYLSPNLNIPFIS